MHTTNYCISPAYNNIHECCTFKIITQFKGFSAVIHMYMYYESRCIKYMLRMSHDQ